jgi:hypothetical protein
MAGKQVSVQEADGRYSRSVRIRARSLYLWSCAVVPVNKRTATVLLSRLSSVGIARALLIAFRAVDQNVRSLVCQAPLALYIPWLIALSVPGAIAVYFSRRTDGKHC